MKTTLLSFLTIFTLIQIGTVNEAHAIFNKKKQAARKEARQEKRAVKQACKSAGGSGSTCRQAGRAAKAEVKAASGAFGVKKTVKLEAKAAKLNTKVDCKLAGNHSRAECRQLGRAASKTVKAESGIFGAKRTARMSAKAAKIETRIDCKQAGNHSRAECRQLGRAASKTVKAESGAFGAKRSARMGAKAAKIETRIDCNQEGNRSRSQCRKLGRAAGKQFKAESGAFGIRKTNRLLNRSKILNIKGGGALVKGKPIAVDSVKVLPSPARPVLVKSNFYHTSGSVGHVDKPKPICAMPRMANPGPGCSYIPDPNAPKDTCPRYIKKCTIVADSPRPIDSNPVDSNPVDSNPRPNPVLPAKPVEPAFNCSTEVSWFTSNCKNSMSGGVTECKAKAGILKSKCARELAALKGAGQSSQSAGAHCPGLVAKTKAICSAQPDGHKCSQFKSSLAQSCPGSSI